MIRNYVKKDFGQVIDLYQSAFSSYPWFENFSNQLVKERLTKDFNRDFYALVFEKDGKIIGITWFERTSIGVLKEERGEDLALLLESRNANDNLLWIRDTLILPEVQGQGIASKLKIAQSVQIQKFFPFATILTRMRDDNFGIIKINERLGMQRTGIRVQSVAFPGVWHEYWWK